MDALLPEFFRRQDERPDALFYRRPRLGRHVDEAASRWTQRLYEELLPPGASVLDLMASRRSHLHERFPRVVGLGLNRAQLEANPRIDEAVVFDLNRSADLPFPDAAFGGAVCTASVQYMVRPAETFAAVARVLEPGAPFVVSFSNRMYPSKAVLAWRCSDDAAHLRLVESYFARTPGFSRSFVRRHVPDDGDPMFAVWAYREVLP